MPGTDGFDVLRWIKTRPELVDMRVVVLTSSHEMRDVSGLPAWRDSFLMSPSISGTRLQWQSHDAYWMGLNISPGTRQITEPDGSG